MSKNSSSHLGQAIPGTPRLLGSFMIGSYELSSSLKVYHRAVYSVFDYLSDVGGLSGALYPLFYVLISILQYKSSHMFMMNSQMHQDANDKRHILHHGPDQIQNV